MTATAKTGVPYGDMPSVPDSATELELKFVVLPDQVAALRKASWVRPLQQGRTTARILNAVYFDTPQRQLWNAGFTLRIRKEGARYIQTVKTREALSDQAFTRGEWQSPVAQATPDAGAILPLPGFDSVLNEAVLAALEPLFETRIRRTVRRLHTPEGSVVEWALDIGEVGTKAVVEPIGELELELVSGPADGLFRIARELTARVPLRLSNVSKSARGYALASGNAAPWRKASDIVLPSGATAEDALAHTVSQCLDHLMGNEECVLKRSHAEGIHQMRVALRRFRSALNIYRGLLPSPEFDRLDGHAKRCIGAFGPARDWDVFLSDILAPVADWITDTPALAALHAAAERARDGAYGQAQALLLSPDYTAILLDIGAWLNGRGWRKQALSEKSADLLEPAQDLGRATLKKRHAKLLKAGRHLKTMSVQERHRLRIAVKKQRYATEFFASLFPKKAAQAYVQRLSALQDHLGLLNDIATADGLTHDLAGAAAAGEHEDILYAAGLVVGWHQQELKAHEAALVRDWNKLKATKPFW